PLFRKTQLQWIAVPLFGNIGVPGPSEKEAIAQVKEFLEMMITEEENFKKFMSVGPSSQPVDDTEYLIGPDGQPIVFKERN
ncbi:MAG: hypothetical protein ACXADF_19030, partial [Candidatus Thorarchaeota archaeon]